MIKMIMMAIVALIVLLNLNIFQSAEVAIRPWAGRSGVRIPKEAKDISPKCPDWL